MQAIGISIVKNEEDIIESFIRHNLQFLDGIIVFDNCSTDSTRLILKLLMQEGLPICLADDDEYAYLQSEKMTNLLRRVSSAIPVDFVIPLDADELIDCQDYSEFAAALSRIESPGLGSWKWRTYLLSPDRVEAEGPGFSPDRFHWFRAQELPQYQKVVLRAPDQYIDDLVLGQGSHHVLTNYHLPIVELDPVVLAHFPVRSQTQILKKAIFGGLAYEIKDKQQNRRDPVQGYQWRSLFQRFLRGETLSGLELINLSLNYAQSPGQLQWPDNTCKGQFNLVQPLRRYDAYLTSNLLIETVRSFQTYIAGSDLPLDPTEFYHPATPQQAELNSTSATDGRSDTLELDIPPFKYLSERFSPTSVLELGCGKAPYLRLLNNLGATQIVGVDTHPPIVSYVAPENYITQDLFQSFDLRAQFDLVVCCEVTAQLDAEWEQLLANISTHAHQVVLFSAVAPEQPGYEHLPLQPFAVWAEAWAARGWMPLVFETLCFRALSTVSWLRRNPVLMVRSEDEFDAFEQWLSLILISEGDYHYNQQPPAIITNPLKHNFPV